MNTRNEDRETIVSHCFEPFPEPQTIPSGWDLSGVLSAPEPFDLAHPSCRDQRRHAGARRLGRPAPVTEEDDSLKGKTVNR